MKGNNELILNEATMIQAIQFWLDSKMVQQAPKVTSVKPDKDTGPYPLSFKVSLDADADRANQ